MYPVKTPITERPPYEPAYEPYLKVGSLVTLKTIEQNHDNNIPFWKNKNFALVQEVYWNSHDCWWDEDGFDAPSHFISVPSSTLLWNDGETTCTSQNALEVISESR
jgi:hypothetical protein